MALFYRQLAAMLDAGVPLHHALTTLTISARPRRLRARLEALCGAVARGTVLSIAMADHAGVFTPFQRALIAAGEASGNLDTAARWLADHLEQAWALRQEIRRELFTSKLTMALVLLFWPGVLIRLAGRPWLLLLGILPLASFAALLMLSGLLPHLTGRSSRRLDAALWRMPLLRSPARAIAQANFARCLALLYHAGLPVPEAVCLAAEAGGNSVLAERVRLARRSLSAGGGIADALAATDALAPMVITMLHNGEVTGDLDGALERVAWYFREDVKVHLHQLKVALGVTAVLNAGFCVGLIAVSSYT